MFIYANIADPSNIATESARTMIAALRAAADLEASTCVLEAKLSRQGFARRSYNMGRMLSGAVVLAIVNVAVAVAQIGGAL